MNTPEETEATITVERTRELLKTKGWCVWTCSNLDNDKIMVIDNRYQISFDNKLPVYTLDELRDLGEQTIKSIRLVHLAKKEGAQRMNV